jgi:hypothetical protein
VKPAENGFGPRRKKLFAPPPFPQSRTDRLNIFKINRKG